MHKLFSRASSHQVCACCRCCATCTARRCRHAWRLRSRSCRGEGGIRGGMLAAWQRSLSDMAIADSGAGAAAAAQAAHQAGVRAWLAPLSSPRRTGRAEVRIGFSAPPPRLLATAPPACDSALRAGPSCVRLRRVERLPGLPSSRLGLEALTGELDDFSFASYLGLPGDSEVRSCPCLSYTRGPAWMACLRARLPACLPACLSVSGTWWRARPALRPGEAGCGRLRRLGGEDGGEPKLTKEGAHGAG